MLEAVLVYKQLS